MDRRYSIIMIIYHVSQTVCIKHVILRMFYNKLRLPVIVNNARYNYSVINSRITVLMFYNANMEITIFTSAAHVVNGAKCIRGVKKKKK